MFRSEVMGLHVWRVAVMAVCLVLFLELPISLAESGTHATAFLHPTAAPGSKRLANAGGYRLVAEPTLILDYHFGPVMTGRDNRIKLFVVYYGAFTSKQRSTLGLFFRSFRESGSMARKEPTVRNWWGITHLYVDLFNEPVGSELVLAGETVDKYSLGKNIKQHDIQKLVLKSTKKFGTDARSIYLVLTSDDVLVERFCMNVCGTHFYTFPSDATESQMVPYGWVGNPATQCPELCSWPYAPGGLLQKGLVPPNGDIGIDGMIITIGNLLAGLATNPFGNAYSQADGLEAAAVCQGIYGAGSFAGYPGELLLAKSTNASFNVYGAKNSKFLLPYVWHPATTQCAGQA